MNNSSAEGLPAVIESSDSFDSGIKSSSRSPSLTSIDRWPIFFSSSRKARPERKFPKRKSSIQFQCNVNLTSDYQLFTIVSLWLNHSTLNNPIAVGTLYSSFF